MISAYYQTVAFLLDGYMSALVDYNILTQYGTSDAPIGHIIESKYING